MYNKQASGQQGFTLIEAMIVVAVIAVLLAVAVPSFSDFFEKNRLKRATEAVYGLITKARAETVIRDMDLFVTVDSDVWCAGYAAAADCDCTETDPGVADACAVPVAGVNVLQRVDGASFTDVVITNDFDSTFNSIKGTANNDTVNLTVGVWALNIVVNTRGHIRICAPNANRTMGYSGC